MSSVLGKRRAADDHKVWVKPVKVIESETEGIERRLGIRMRFRAYEFAMATAEKAPEILAEMLTGPVDKLKLFAASALSQIVSNADLPKLKLLVSAEMDLLQQVSIRLFIPSSIFTLVVPGRTLTTDQGLFIKALHASNKLRTNSNKLDTVRYLLDECKTTDGIGSVRPVFDLHKIDAAPLILSVRKPNVELSRLLLNRGAIGINQAMLKLLLDEMVCRIEDDTLQARETFKLLIYRGANYYNREPLPYYSSDLFNDQYQGIRQKSVQYHFETSHLWKVLSRKLLPTPITEMSTKALRIDYPSFACLFPDERDHHLPSAQKYLHRLLASWRVGNDVDANTEGGVKAVLVVDSSSGSEKFVDIGKQKHSDAAINWASKQCEQVVRREVLSSSKVWIPPLADIVCTFFAPHPVIIKCQN